jgi:chemotaxis protein MotA
MQKIVGICVVIVCVFGGFVMASGKLIALWQPYELVIIIGAALGSMVIGNSKEVLLALIEQVKGVFKKALDEKELYRELLSLMHLLIEDIRVKGMKDLDEHIEAPHSSSIFLMAPEVMERPLLVNFIVDNLRMIGIGKISAHEIEAILDAEITSVEEELLYPSHSLHKTAEAMPGFGILAAVLGIIVTMQHLDGPLVTIGAHVAAALVGTFIGIFACYCLMEPLSAAMASNVKRDLIPLECVKAILVSYVSGKAAILSVDAGRRVIEMGFKPSFTEMEEWVNNRAM